MSVLLDLTGVKATGDRIERTFEPKAFAGGDDEFIVTAAVRLAFDVRKRGEDYNLAGEVHTTLGLTCSRCLDPFEIPLDARFDLTYVPAARNAGEGELEVGAEDLTTAFYRDDAIDLGQLLREQFYLGLPMKPLCEPGCLGLCPRCGANRNTAPCGCPIGWEDPRLAALRAVLRTRAQD